MVEQIRISPEEVRGYGNVCEEHSLDDFTVNMSSLSKVSETVHGALTNTYKLLYSVYGLMFDFDKGAKQLYLQTNEADTLSLGFDTANKQLYLVDEEDTGFSLDFDEDTNELYITDDAPPVVHNYSLALDQSSYTTTGSLSVSATLLDDGVAVSGATVSFTGGVSTVTATTNSSGVATATVNFTSSGTLTASYSNVSDTASVTVSHNYSLAFSSSSYVATGGSAEVSVTLLDDNVAVSGATVTFTGGTSTVTGVTNSSGVATATVSVSATSTITATYQNVTDTCTITVPSAYIFYDECNSSSGLTNYGTLVSLESATANANLTYDSTENAYALTSLSSSIKAFPITQLNGLDDFKLSFEFRTPSTTQKIGLGLTPMLPSTHTGIIFFVNQSSGGRESVIQIDKNHSETYWGDGQSISNYNTSNYYKLELIIDGDTATWNLYDYNSTLLRTYNYTLSNITTDYNTLSNRAYGIAVGYQNNSSAKMYIKNIKAEYI